MVIESTFGERFFRSVSSKIGQKLIIFVPKLYVIGDLIFALNLDEKYKIIMNQSLVY